MLNAVCVCGGGLRDRYISITSTLRLIDERQKMKLCLKGKNKIRKFNDEAGTVRVNSGPGTLGSVVEELRQTDL